MCLTDRAAERQPDGRGDQGDEQAKGGKEKRVDENDLHSPPHGQPGRREDDQPSDERLEHAADDLFNRDPLDLDRREQPILDLSRELELGDQRHRHCLDPREQHRESNNAGEKQALVLHRHIARCRQDSAEHENEKHRLKQRLEQQRKEVSPRHAGIAAQQSEKRFEVHSRKFSVISNQLSVLN